MVFEEANSTSQSIRITRDNQEDLNKAIRLAFLKKLLTKLSNSLMEIKVRRGKEMLIHDGMQMIKSQEGVGFCKGSVMFICSLEKRSQQTNEKNDF